MTSQGDELEEFNKFWDMASSGNTDAMRELADLIGAAAYQDDREAGKDWLRRAWEHGAPEAADELARAFSLDDQYEQAARWYRLAFEGGIEGAAGGLIRALLALGQGDEAERLARQWVDTQPSADRLARLADVLLMLGQGDEAERLARQWVDTQPSADRLATLANVLKMLGQLDEAEQHARRSVEIQPDLNTLGVLISVLFQQGRTLEAFSWEDEQRKYIPAGPVIESMGAAVAFLAAAAAIAVVPFVKGVLTKAGEDSYAAARAMVRWIFWRGFRRGRRYHASIPSEAHPVNGNLLVVEDLDRNLELAISLGASNEQLNALKDFDVDKVAAQAQRRDPQGTQARAILIHWDEVSQSWRTYDPDRQRSDRS